VRDSARSRSWRPRRGVLRRLTPRLGAVVLGAVALPALLAAPLAEQARTHRPQPAPGPGVESAPARLHLAPPQLGPEESPRERLEGAQRFAAGRDASAGFAIVSPDGKLRGREEHRLFTCASVVKSMLLAAELHRLDDQGLPLDAGTRSLLSEMITISDNDAATAIYGRVGDEGLYRVANLAGMDDFRVQYSWGFAKITAADMARMFSELDRVLPQRYRQYGLGLLGSITPEQSWGIPAVAEPAGWSVRFKGGWLQTDAGQLVSQAAELRRDGTTLGMAILTDGEPSMAYGIETVKGIAMRLLGARAG
jgi:hypothetical protein